MPQVQAFCQACDESIVQKFLPEFFENSLNLYAVDLKTDLGGVKEIFEGTPKREWIFENIRIAVERDSVERIILINHTACEAYPDFPHKDAEIETHGIHLRHAVSDVKAKFPQVIVEAYLILVGELDQPTTFQKIV